MKITSIHIKNYRSIEDSTEFPITKLFALIGRNNCGKSAFIDAIRVLWQEKDLNAKDFHKGGDGPVFIKVVLEDIKNYTDNGGKLEIVCEGVKDKDKVKTELKFNGKKPAAKDIKTFLPKLLTIPAIRNPENETTAGSKSVLRELISSVLKLNIDEQLDIAQFAETKAKDLKLEEINSLLEVKSKEALANISKIMSDNFQDALSDESVALELDPDGNLSKAITFCTNIIDPHLGKDLKSVNILSCGTGLQSMVILCLLQAFAHLENKDDSIMLVEEPEVYLHPELQRKMFYALREIAEDTQVIYTTHSPIMISELWVNESIKLVKRKEGKTLFSQVDIPGVISELGIRYEDILNPTVTVFVEGDSDAQLFRTLALKLLPSHADNIDRRIKFIATDGYRKIHAYALVRILNSTNVDAPFFLIADGDGYDSEERKKYIADKIVKEVPEAEAKGPLANKINVLQEHEIESYFLDYDLLKEIVPSLEKFKFDTFYDKYILKYDEARERYKKSKTSENLELLAQFRPSLLFTNFKKEIYSQKFIEKYDGDADFMAVRDEIALVWKDLEKSGESPVSKMFENYRVGSNAKIGELEKLVSEILQKTATKAEEQAPKK